MAFEYGYEGVCSAYGDYNFGGDDPFHIRRIHAETCCGSKIGRPSIPGDCTRRTGSIINCPIIPRISLSPKTKLTV